MKKLFTLLFATLLVAGIAGCSKDDEAPQIDHAQLIGTWEIKAAYDGEYDEWHYDFGAAYNDITRYQFNADGTGVYTSTGLSNRPYSFTYSINDNVVSVKFTKEAYMNSDYPLEKLVENELIWITDEYTGDDGGTYLDKQLFARIQ